MSRFKYKIEYSDTCVLGIYIYKNVWRPCMASDRRRAEMSEEEDNTRGPYAVVIEM